MGDLNGPHEGDLNGPKSVGGGDAPRYVDLPYTPFSIHSVKLWIQ